jgi:Leucine-rich repeat (LRR) protein
MNLNFGLIFVIVVGTLWSADGYKCDFKSLYGIKYYCIVVPDSSEDVEKHVEHKSDDDVQMLSFDADHHSISHVTQSESTPFCQRFKKADEFQASGDKLESIDKDAFKNCQHIKKIDIWFSNVREFPENLFSANPKLTHLSLLANKLTTLPENIFASQTSLVLLSLNSNPFTSLPANVFDPLVSLNELHLRKINLKFNPIWFKNLKALFSLDISRNQLTDLPKNSFSALESLEDLDLTFNQLTVIHSDSFGNLKSLKTITLEENNVLAIDEQLIANTALNHLDMNGNKCSNEDIEEREELNGKLAQCFSNYQPRQEE